MAGLDISIREMESHPQAALAEMAGAIDGTTVVSFQDALEDMKKKGVQRLVLDMSKIKYVNSTGLGSLVKYADAFKSSGGGMALIKVPAKVKIVIEMLGLHAFFEICADLDSALEALDKAVGGAAPAAAAAPPPPAKRMAPPRPMAAPPPMKPVSRPPPVKPVATPAPAPAPAPAVSAGGAGNTVACQSCKTSIVVPGSGNFKCPRCFTLFSMQADGAPKFLKSDKPQPATLSLSCNTVCSDGLKAFIGSVCGASNGTNVDAVKQAVGEVCTTISTEVYPGNPDGVYHVSVEHGASQVTIKFSDSGIRIDPARLGQIMPSAMQTFRVECLPHPVSGNILRLVLATA